MGRAAQREGARSPPERTRKLWIVYGDVTETEFRAEREVIEKEIARVRALPEVATIRHGSHPITDVVAAWHDANPDQQARLAAGILSQLHVKDGKINAIRPRPTGVDPLLRGAAGVSVV